MNLTRVKSATSEFIKILVYGKSDVRTADSVTPHGFDSKPVKDDLAIYARTNDSGQPVVLGYLKNFTKTKEGETRIFATNKDGVEVFDIYLKNDGTIEIGGNADFMVRFNPLNSGLSQQDTDINAELVKIAAAINAIVPGSYTPTPIITDIAGAKIEKIKTL